MAKASFMSMRWLRLHIKEIIWTTVLLFVVSCFFIGWGTSRAQRSIEDRQRKAEAEAERREKAEQGTIPEAIRAKLASPAVLVSLPFGTASLTQTVDVRSVFRGLAATNEYKRLQTMPPQYRATFGSQLRENMIEQLIMKTLIELYGATQNLRSSEKPAVIIDRDRKSLPPGEFDRRLRQEGMTESEYAQRKMEYETMQKVYQSVVKPLASGTPDEAVLKKFYEDNKIRFKEDDEISFKHFLIGVGDFIGQASSTEKEIKDFYDSVAAKDFMSSERVSVFHIIINASNAEYLKAFAIDQGEARQSYATRKDDFKVTEKVRASHILIKPRNNFEKNLDTFRISMRNFSFTPEASQNASESKPVYTFDAGISEVKSGMTLAYEDISLIGSGGARLNPTAEGQASLQKGLKLPLSGSPENYVQGTVGFAIPSGFVAEKLEIKDRSSIHIFDVSGAHDEELAFGVAEREAKAVLARLEGGESFDKLAKELSDDEGSAQKGGDLGQFERGQMVKPFEDAAFAAKIGTIAGPVRSRFGYHLIKVFEHVPEKIRPFEEVKAEIESTLAREQAEMKAANDLENLKDLCERSVPEEKVKIFQNHVRMYTMGKSRENGGKLPPFYKGDLQSGYTDANLAILRDEIAIDGKIIPEIEEEVFKLSPHELSRVIKTDKGLHLFMMDSHLPPVQLELKGDVLEKVKDALDEKKRKKMAESKAVLMAGKIDPASFDAVASEACLSGVANLGPLPFSKSPGFSSFGLVGGIGQVTMDGHTYLPSIQKALVDALAKGGTNASGTVIGPVESDLGYHFMMITSFQGEKYQPFDKVKDKIRRVMTLDVTEEDIKEEFEKSKASFEKPARWKLRQIIVQEEEVAKDIYARLLKGEIFGLLAKQYSIDGSGSQGGAIGEVAKGQLPASVEEQVEKLRKGQFTPPCRTSFGWVIILMESDPIPGQPATLNTEAKGVIRKKLKESCQQDAFENFLEGLRRQAYIVRYNDNLKDL